MTLPGVLVDSNSTDASLVSSVKAQNQDYSEVLGWCCAVLFAEFAFFCQVVHLIVSGSGSYFGILLAPYMTQLFFKSFC